MKIYISQKLAEAIKALDEEKSYFIIDKIYSLNLSNKSEIIESDNTLEIKYTKEIKLYAYKMKAELYFLFSFIDKNTIIVHDVLELDKGKAKTLVSYDSNDQSNN